MKQQDQTPVLELDGVTRIFIQGGEEFKVLKGISLSILPGEFVAIIGQSGSGKTTLMNILGCLDKPTGGSYRVKGRDVADYEADELSDLRREVFGFVFQRYNLLNGSSAGENVEMPALYAGIAQDQRRSRAKTLLARLGLGERTEYYPPQLSGGQQQRVSIARALMNGGEIILADEPTGALDRNSGLEVLALFDELHREGHTIILITHDSSVAARSDRVITISDGMIVSDERKVDEAVNAVAVSEGSTAGISERRGIPLAAAIGMALKSLKSNRFRTMLTLLGIIIGVASVVAMLAIGNGAKAKVLESISAIGNDLIMVRQPATSTKAAGDGGINHRDVAAIRALPGVEAAVGENTGAVSIRYQEADYNTTYTATGVDKPVVANWALAQGQFFNDEDVALSAPVAVLGRTVVDNVFPPEQNPVGSYVLLGNVPFLVIGVMETKGANPFGGDQDDMVLVPVSTAELRLSGNRYLNSIQAKGFEGCDMAALEKAIDALMSSNHGGQKYRIMSTSTIMAASLESQNTLTILLGSVAAISLLVGGIGVMNIMLVSVVERTREIGVRMACGARQRDIMNQFLTEALLVCLLGGILGVALGLLTGYAAQLYGTAVQYTLPPILLAFGCSLATGMIFGFTPARKAARLDPVVALASE